MANSNSDIPPTNRRALLRDNKPYQPLRRPNESTRSGEGENSHSNEGKQTDSEASKSTLSVDAQEFYPKNFQTSYLPLTLNEQVSTPPPQQHHRPPLATSRYQHIMGSSASHLRAQGPHGSHGHPHSPGNVTHHQPRSFQNWSPRNNYSRKNEESNEGSMTTTLANGITILESHFNTLTLDPGSFHRCMDSVASIVSNLATSNQEAINSVVSLLLDRCIEEPNFRYSGARLCHSLNQNQSLQPSFRNSLLDRLKLENSEFKVNLSSNNKKTRAFGFLFALAEVFSQHCNSEDEHFGELATYLTENLQLLINEPNSEHIKFACQILKLTGYQLSKKIAVTNQLRTMIERLIQLPQMELGLDRTALCLISSVRDLSACNWGHISSPSTPPNASVGDFSAGDNTPNNHADGVNEPVFYGPDGLVLSPEESQFLAENLSEANENDEDNFSTNGVLDDDDLDDDYDEAYEKFLEHMKNQSNI